MTEHKTPEIKWHPAAGIFPLLEVDSEEFQALVESIRQHGLREPIKLHDGRVIDGRNRMTACKMAGVEPQFEDATVNGSVCDYVFDMNFHRRQLTEGAKKLAAGRYKEVAAEEAKERQRQHAKTSPGKPKNTGGHTGTSVSKKGKARDIAGQKFGVSGKAADLSQRVLKKGSEDLIKAVENGTVKVATAARLANAPKSVQSAAVKGGPAAIRAAIKKYSPSINDEARSDPGVKWHKSIGEITLRLITTREAGGIEELCRRWTPELMREYRDSLTEMIEEMQTWTKALTNKLAKS